MIQKSFCSKLPEEFPAYPLNLMESEKSMLEHLFSHLVVNPISATHYLCTPEWRVLPRILQNSHWTLLIHGHGIITIGDNIFRAEPGDLIFFPEGIRHSFDHTGEEDCEMINVHFHAKIYGLMDILRLQKTAGVFRDSSGLSSKISVELARIFALKPPCYNLFMTQMIKSLLLCFMYHVQNISPNKITDFKQLQRLFPALEMIEQRLGDPDLKQSNLADKLRISEVYLRKMFNALFGESLVKFINHRRIELACKLLRESDLPIKTVAADVGFRDVQFFYRVFARVTNMTPASYRNTSDF